MKNANKLQLIAGLGLILFGTTVNAQNGLDSLVVEKYYVANAADATAADNDATGSGFAAGALPSGSVTYRIYASIHPGYKFEALYGNSTHPFKVTTTGKFYNNSAGGNTPTNWSRTAMKNTTGNVLALDSWFSVGAAASNAYGILKKEDSTAWGANLVTNASGSVLQNADGTAGIPLAVKDGYFYSAFAPTNLPAPPTVTFVGFSTELNVFTDGSTIGNSFSTTNGSVASLNGSTGPTASNRVLVGQFTTTDGSLCYQLNVQVGTPSGGTQQFVASSPTGAEIGMPSLMNCIPAIITTVKEKSSTEPSFKLYPNPAQEQVTLFISSGAKSGQSNYTVFNILGAEILHRELGQIGENHLEHVDVSSLAPGVYFVRVSLDGVISTRRFTKE